MPSSVKKGISTHSSILALRIPWTEEPGGLQSIGSQRVRHDWSDLACTHALKWVKVLLVSSLWPERSYSVLHQQVAILSFCWLLLSSLALFGNNESLCSLLPPQEFRGRQDSKSPAEEPLGKFVQLCEDGFKRFLSVHTGLLGLWPSHTLGFNKSDHVAVK